MSYLKFRSDYLFTGTEMLDSRALLVIREDGTILDLIREAPDQEDALFLHGILSPGFVNCHCHLELSHMKGTIPKHTGLPEFVVQVMRGREVPGEQISEAILKAEDEMRQGGIVAVGDICNMNLTLPAKRQRRMTYHNFVEIAGWNPAAARSRFDAAKSLYDGFSELDPGESRTSIVPHAPYSVSDNLWDLLAPTFHGQTICIHNQESADENELFRQGGGGLGRAFKAMHIENPTFHPTGKSSLLSVLPRMESAGRLLLVHNTYTRRDDLEAIKNEWPSDSALFFCLCPNANLYIENQLPDLPLIMQSGWPIVLGTDSLASNDQLSIWAELVTVRKYFPAIGLEEIMRWATLDGARALQMENTLGSFAAGKKPGLIQIDTGSVGAPEKEAVIRRIV